MDKQRDFEKGWEEYKAKRKQEIEELCQDIYDNCPDLCENGCGDKPCYKCIAEALHRDNYRKIPENAVVLTREEWKRMKSSLYYSKEECERRNQKICKETAEKFAERLKEKLNEWLEDNEDLDGKINFGIAQIELIGVKSLDGEIIAESLIEEICKEITDKEVQNGN